MVESGAWSRKRMCLELDNVRFGIAQRRRLRRFLRHFSIPHVGWSLRVCVLAMIFVAHACAAWHFAIAMVMLIWENVNSSRKQDSTSIHIAIDQIVTGNYVAFYLRHSIEKLNRLHLPFPFPLPARRTRGPRPLASLVLIAFRLSLRAHRSLVS